MSGIRNLSKKAAVVGMAALGLCILGLGQGLRSQLQHKREFLTSDLVMTVHEVNQLQRELLRLNHQVMVAEATDLQHHSQLVQSRIKILQTFLASQQERSSFAPGVAEELNHVVEQWQAIRLDIDAMSQGAERVSVQERLLLQQRSSAQLQAIELKINQLAHANRSYQWANYNELLDRQKRSLNYITSLLLLFFAFSLLFSLYIVKLIETRQRLLEEMKQASTTDELTQIGNRRYFNQVFYREWNHMMREQKSIALILCDIDFFKQYNDHYGHQAGDVCLHQIAQVLASGVRRSNEAVARYGGEEFVIIFPNTNPEQAEQEISRLLQKVRQAGVEHCKSSVSDCVTLSMGVAVGIPTLALKPEHALECADRALYRAKTQGRNQACFECFDRQLDSQAEEVIS